MWDKGVKLLNKSDPVLDQFVGEAMAKGLNIMCPNFTHSSSEHCKKIIWEKLLELWNNQTSNYRTHLTKCE